MFEVQMPYPGTYTVGKGYSNSGAVKEWFVDIGRYTAARKNPEKKEEL